MHCAYKLIYNRTLTLMHGVEMSRTLETESNCIQPSYTRSNLIALLPHLEHSQLISKEQKGRFLHLIHSLITSAVNGLNEFKEGKLTQFDAQIGENLCQIRAYHITFLAQKYFSKLQNQSFFQSKIDVLIDFQNTIKQKIIQFDIAVKNSSQYNKNLDKTECVKEFLERNSLTLELDHDIIYLAACYFLSRFSTKSNGVLQSLSLTKIAETLSTSKSQAKKCVQTYQNQICALDFEFVQQILDDLPQLNHYKKILPNLLKDSGDSRRILPCFVASDIIFHHAHNTQTPIFLSIQRIGTHHLDQDLTCLLIIGNQYLQPLEINNKELLSRACVVIEAEVHDHSFDKMETTKDYIERLLLINPMKSVLANTAIHPQYAGELLHSLADNPFVTLAECADKKTAEDAFHLMREFAIQFGCHKDNASTFLMKHAYSNSLGHQIEQISQTKMNSLNVTHPHTNHSLISRNFKEITLN